mgnify:FL=1|tara:strand:+ start:234 stop:476 length:243 start_codon:yes stop_codon:yes gene_type:complete
MGQQIVYGNKLSLINFYKEQLQKFNKLGIGNRTEKDILITDTLIRRTKKRLGELASLYESELTEAAFRQRRYKLEENLPL